MAEYEIHAQIYFSVFIAQLAGTVEYTDSISAEG